MINLPKRYNIRNNVALVGSNWKFFGYFYLSKNKNRDINFINCILTKDRNY